MSCGNTAGYGLVAQLGAHHIRIVGVGSSNLLKSTAQRAKMQTNLRKSIYTAPPGWGCGFVCYCSCRMVRCAGGPAHHRIGQLCTIESQNQLPGLGDADLELHQIGANIRQREGTGAGPGNACAAVGAILCPSTPDDTNLYCGIHKRSAGCVSNRLVISDYFLGARLRQR